jgi:hypothetical protein
MLKLDPQNYCAIEEIADISFQYSSDRNSNKTNQLYKSCTRLKMYSSCRQRNSFCLCQCTCNNSAHCQLTTFYYLSISISTIRLSDVENPTLSGQSAQGWPRYRQPYASAALYSPEICLNSGTHFC